MIKFNWGTGITLFLVLFLALAFYFIYFSFQHRNDLVTDDYYERGANYDDQMLIDKRSLVYKDSILAVNSGDHITLSIAPGIAAITDSIHAYFYFPSDKSKDLHIDIKDFTNNTFVEKDRLAKGRYILKYSWKVGVNTYMTSQDFFVSK